MSMLRAMVDGLSAEQQINELAKEMSLIHGDVHIRHESSGTHLTMACPKCLQDYGRRELRSKHLQINADKYLGLGKFKKKWDPAYRDDRNKKKGYAQCMKEHGPFSMTDIRSYPPLDQRVENASPIRVRDGGGDRYLVPDESGVMIPDHPGKVTPVTQLPYGHQALQYLRYRDYDPALLYNQFRCSWCYEEAPEGEFYRRFYRRHGDGWKSTPQGRLIFYSDVAGHQVCWQGRYLEIEHEGRPLVWHPYLERWENRPDWGKTGPMKYITATGGLKNNQLCGYDAVRWAMNARREAQPLCVLTEGPLDAARFPDRGMAIFGKSMGEEQVLLVSVFYRRAVLAFDADAAGASACRKVSEQLAARGVRTVNFFTEAEQQSEGKLDVGMLGYAECARRLRDIMNRF